ncbi:MAG: hypothetical protein ACHQWH_02690 [Nitrososphaerales archaeon]
MARLVLGHLAIKADARMKPKSLTIKSYAKLAAAERRSQPGHQQILQMRELLSEINDRVGRLEGNDDQHQDYKSEHQAAG